MAEFNPQIQDTGTNDQTRTSRGKSGDTSLGSLFSGIGDTISAGVGTADNYIKNRIEDQARYGLNNLNEGTTSVLEDASAASSARMNGTAGTQSSQTPGAITSAGQSLQTLAMARDQGKITNEFYYQQLNSQLKSLRARYPGYEKDVDQIVQQVTGVQPANAYRQALQQKIQADAQVMQSSANKWDEYKKQNAGYIQMAFPDYFTNPDKYTGQENQIQAGVAKIKGDEQSWEYQLKSNTNNQEVLKQNLGGRLSQVSQSFLSGASKASGITLPSFVDTLSKAGQGQGLSNDQIATLNGQFDNYSFAVRSQLMNEANRPELSSVSPQDKQQMVDAAMKPILDVKEMLANKNYQGAARLAAQNEAMQTQGLADLYKQSPMTATAVGISKVAPEVGQYIMQQVIDNMGGVKNFVKATAIGDQVGSVITGDDTLSDVNGRVINSKNMSGPQKNQIVSSVVNSSLDAIRNGKVEPQQVSTFVQNNYNNDKDIFKQVTGDQPDSGQSQYLKLYTKIFDPKITDQVLKTGDQKLINQYYDYAVDKFRSIPEIRTAQNTVSSNVDYNKFFRAYYDEARNKVVIEADQNAINNQNTDQRPGASNPSRIALQQTQKAASSLNQALSVMSPIIEGAGQNEAQTVQELIGSLGQSGSQRGFLTWVGDAIAASNAKSTGNAPEGTYKEVPLDEPVGPEGEQVQYNVPLDAGKNWVKSSDMTPGTRDDVEAFARKTAGDLGIDPDVAVRVMRSEGLDAFDPRRPDLGGDDKSSFGPMQLHYGGKSQQYPNPGLGDEFTKATGLDASDPSTWRQQIEFGLNYAKENGWSSWMGARNAGIGRFDGISARGGEGSDQAGIKTANTRGYDPDISGLTKGMQVAVSGLQAGLRDILGKDVPVISGYRDPERNAKAGGAKHSQHMEGDAVDLDVSHLSQSEKEAVIQNAISQGFTGIGVYPNSIHIDQGKQRAWGPSFSKDSLPGWAAKVIDNALAGNIGGFRENMQKTEQALGKDAGQGQVAR
jgi:hypothetical protein